MYIKLAINNNGTLVGLENGIYTGYKIQVSDLAGNISEISIKEIIGLNNLVEGYSVFKLYPSSLDIRINKIENKKKNAEERIKQLKNQAMKDIKNASVKIAIESVEKLIKNSLDKSKLDKIYSSSIEETKLALKKKSS